MRHLTEALSKSQIKKIKKYLPYKVEFNPKDLENGDLVIKRTEIGRFEIWMYLSNKEVEERQNEFFQPDEKDFFEPLRNGYGFIVLPQYRIMNWGLFRTPISNIIKKNTKYYLKSYDDVWYPTIIKTNGKFLNSSKTMHEIFTENNNFNEYLNY